MYKNDLIHPTHTRYLNVYLFIFLNDLCCWIVHHHNERATKYSFSYSLNDTRAAPCGSITTVKARILDFILKCNAEPAVIAHVSGVGTCLRVRR